VEQMMSRGSNPAKVQQWTECLERYQKSGQTVARFCQNEGIAEASFYQWKKKLAGQPSASKARLIADSAREHVQPPQQQGESTLAGSRFQSVELLPVPSSVTTILLPNGIEIKLGSDLRVIELLVKQLLQRSADLEAGW
jgi:transposase-like protein